VRFIRVFHIASLALSLLYGVLAAHRLEWSSLYYWCFWLIYFGLVFGIEGDLKWCLRLSVLPPLVIFVLTTPNVVYNIYAFLTGDPLYEDSPATILIVGIVAVCMSLPSGLVLWTYWVNRKQVFSSAR
jgi:hypothetical protein